MKSAAQPLENHAEEQVILGKLLQSEAGYWSVSEFLREEHFSKPIHARIFGAIRDILQEGKKLSLVLIQARIGDEYDDGKSTMTLMTALLRNADEGDLEGVGTIIDLWKRRKHIEELDRSMKEAQNPDTHVDDLINAHTTRLEDISTKGETTPLYTVGQLAARVISRTSAAIETKIRRGFDTGLPSLDEIMGRIHEGDMGVLIAARGDGKTVIGAQLCEHAQKYGPSILFEYEMEDLDIASRALAGETSLATGRGLSVAEIDGASFDAWQWDELKAAAERLKDSKFIVDARPKATLEQAYERCRVVKKTKGLTLAVFDHFRKIRTGRRFADKWERMEYISGFIKSMCKELQIAALVLSQPTRMSLRRDDPFPGLSDLEGGGVLEQDCDWALGAFRRDVWLRSQKPEDGAKERAWADKLDKCKGQIEIRNLKGRRSDVGATRSFIFDGRASLVKEIGGQ